MFTKGLDHEIISKGCDELFLEAIGRYIVLAFIIGALLSLV